MLTALGALLNTLATPLSQMGTLMQMNSAAYMSSTGMPAGSAMSSVAFNVFAGPWISNLGQMSVGLATFIPSLVTFLQGIIQPVREILNLM